MYKIIRKNKVIDVIQNPQFIVFLPYGHVAFADESSAQGVVGSDNCTLYSFKPTTKQGVDVVTLEKITLEEFNRLCSLLNSNQESGIEVDTLASAKKAAIERISTTCKNKITSGFSIKLQDGKLYDFRLTIEDQLNLMSIENQLNSGAETFIYHATDQPCKVFTREDMQKILAAYRKHVLYHTTYFNVAKSYIKSLTDVSSLNSFAYGTDVSIATKDNVLKQILKLGGGNYR